MPQRRPLEWGAGQAQLGWVGVCPHREDVLPLVVDQTNGAARGHLRVLCVLVSSNSLGRTLSHLMLGSVSLEERCARFQEPVASESAGAP